jgi:hypothetical protein
MLHENHLETSFCIKGILPRHSFRWCGLALHNGKGGRSIVTLVADDNHPHLFRIRYPDGWLSTPANISRAKEAAYGHARLLSSPLAEAA